jgi:hypothetical protein
MSSRFLLPGEADSNPICNMWARDTRATGCSVVTGSPVDAPEYISEVMSLKTGFIGLRGAD